MRLSQVRGGAPLTRAARSIAETIARRPYPFALWTAVIGTCLWTIVYPFTVVHYPPLVDLPFHAADTSIIRHYFDPAWHFREQFTFKPLEAPYITMYLLGAIFELFLPTVLAMKAVAVCMLLLLPAGLAVFFAGIRRSPLWGLLGLTFVWCQFTMWGFLNSMGALGLFAATIGWTVRLLDGPTRGRQTVLALLLSATFLTHAFRYPFAAAGVFLTAVLMYPATRRFLPVVVPSLPALAMFGVWLRVRPSTQGMLKAQDLHLEWERLREIPDNSFHSWNGPTERHLAAQMFLVVGAVFLVSNALYLLEGRWRGASRRWLYRGAVTTFLPAALAAGCALLYLTLPMRLGQWWMVYPRETASAGYLALAVMPALPRRKWLQVVLLGAVAIVCVRQANFVATEWAQFEDNSADFREVERLLPRAPKLMYLVFDTGGTDRTMTPYMHLPAWIQAETGGWLGFHLVTQLFYPVRYRIGSPSVPPEVPLGWEWRPTWFDLKKHGAFFDYFLVRDSRAPDKLFKADKSIRRTGHVGTWWLYHRRRDQ